MNEVGASHFLLPQRTASKVGTSRCDVPARVQRAESGKNARAKEGLERWFGECDAPEARRETVQQSVPTSLAGGGGETA